MTTLLYLSGFLIVWVTDKNLTDRTGWQELMHRLAISLFSWATILLFALIQFSDVLGYWLETKYEYKLPKWL